MSTEEKQLVARLGLSPHPEGGWYRETWRADAAPGERAGATAIYFLLEAGQRSHWHRVDATELWFWHAGHPLRLLTAPADDGRVSDILLGPDIAAGEAAQFVVPKNHWQAAEADRGWTLVSCVVTPGFEFSGFELAPEGWMPGEKAQKL